MNVSFASLTPEQQKELRKAESLMGVRNMKVPRLVYDAMGVLEQLILIEHADNVDEHAKKRIRQLREAIKTKVANQR